MRKLNLVFLASTALALMVLGGAAYVIRGRQLERNASVLLDRARQSEEQGQTAKALEALKQYLGLRPRDSEAWRSYARLIDETMKAPRQREQIYLVHQEALRHNPDDPALQRRSVDLALELRPQRTADARRFLKALIGRAAETLENGKQVTDVGKAAVELAELKELDGKCLLLDSDFPAAVTAFNDAISFDPTRVFCYVQLARIERNELHKDPKVADRELDWMIANNPRSGLAHLERFRYLAEFHPPAPENELKQAVELAPEDPDVLLTAALAAEQKKDLAAARGHFEKGLKLHPKNIAFPIALAELETRDGHLDRAKAVLRQADQANSSPDLAFRLAENLIAQNQVDQAEGYFTRLREAGMGDTLVRYLEAQSLYVRKQWSDAIPKIETAQAVLRSLPQLEAALDLWLVDCYGHVGAEEKRLAALRGAAESKTARESTRIELARALRQAGKLDDAIAVWTPLAERLPEQRLDLFSVLIQKASRTPRDPGAWQEAERQLKIAEKTLPQAGETLTLLRADMLAARDRLDEARTLLTAAQSKDTRNISYRLAIARLTQRQGKGPEALKILDEAEKDLGPSLAIQLARLDVLGRQGDVAAKAAVAKLAENRHQLAAVDRPEFLDRLAITNIRLRQPSQARQYLAELAPLQPDDYRVRLALFDLAIEMGEHDSAAELVSQVRKIEGGDKGTNWRFAQATLLIDKARRGKSKDLEDAQRLASEISEERPDWWAGPTLRGELADLAGSPDQAVEHYLRAVELGNHQASLARRLVALLNERNRISDIEHVAKILGGHGVALDEITLIKAIEANRNQDFDLGLKLARQVLQENSTSAADHITLGRFYSSAGQFEMAEKEFRRAVELGPGLPEAWLAYVQHLAKIRQIDKARVAIEAASKALPAGPATLTLTLCWMTVGDLKKAEGLVGKFLGAGGKSTDPSVLKAAVLVALSQNRVDQVRASLDELDQVTNLLASDKALANRIRVALFMNKGRLEDQEQAIKLVEENLRNNPNSLEDRRLKAGLLALRYSRRNEAVNILEQLKSANLLDAKDRFLLAKLYLGRSEDTKYRDEMVKLLSDKVKNPQHLAHLVKYWIDTNQLDQADRWLGELKKSEPLGLPVLELDSRLLSLRNRKSELLALLTARERQFPEQIGPVADLFNRYGFVKEAEKGYRAFIAREPKQPERTLALAQFLAHQNRAAEALQILRQAWKVCPPEQVAEAAVALYEVPSAGEDARQQVEAWVIEAARKQPDAVRLESKLGAIWIFQGRLLEAEALYRRVLSSDPTDALALNNLAWLLAMRDPAKADESLSLINKAVDLYGPTAMLVGTRGVILIRAGKLDEAVDELTSAFRRTPDRSSVAVHLAWALRAKGRSEEARKQFLRAEELGLDTRVLDPLDREVIQNLKKELFPS